MTAEPEIPAVDAAASAGDKPQSAPADAKPKSETLDFLSFLVKLALVIFLFRSLVFAPFNIPSESMQPRLIVGDYLLAAKWPYGYSRYSLPWSMPLIPGRVFASQPVRGDVVVFKQPPTQRIDYIKRVIGLPGDQIQMIGGELHINGTAVPKRRIADFVVAQSPNTRCFAPVFEDVVNGDPVCRYPQFAETLPEGRTYNVLDLTLTPQDDTDVFIVPEGSLFLMGDNRDNSQDSRFPAIEGQGIGIVPQANLVGRAQVVIFSTDGSAEWIKPWTWFSAARWDRVGKGFLSGDAARAFLESLLEGLPADAPVFEEALTHGSTGAARDYQRLEFLGDRVLGLAIAEWLYERHEGETEGQLSTRLNRLVSREACAEAARAIGLPPHIRLGKQARDDGGRDSPNILGDVMESLIGAVHLTHGNAAARAFVRRVWVDRMEGHESAGKHPKSALQEWAASRRRKPPRYTLLDRSGPDHALLFTVKVEVTGEGEAEAVGASKQEAETAAARALMEKLP